MIYFLAPENTRPTGGVRVIYRHVDILNQHGIDAAVLHQKQGFRADWFDNETRIFYLQDCKLSSADFLVIPEVYGPSILSLNQVPNIGIGVKKIIFNQGCYNTFFGYSFEAINSRNLRTPYTKTDEFIATIVVSQNSKDYINHLTPNMPVYRIHNCVDPTLFTYQKPATKQICFTPNKHPEDAFQVLAMLQVRGLLKDYTVVPITHMREKQVARVMQQSSLFLSTSYHEGFGLLPAEAMSSGCIVIGYDGMGGQEYFQPDFCYPVATGDILSFARTVESVIKALDENPESHTLKSKMAADYIGAHYSPEGETRDVIACWESIISQ